MRILWNIIRIKRKTILKYKFNSRQWWSELLCPVAVYYHLSLFWGTWELIASVAVLYDEIIFLV